MEFSDIDPSQFLDQLSWDAQDNGDISQGDGDDRRRQSSLDNESEFSCDLNAKSERDDDDGRGQYPWDVLMGPLDVGLQPMGEPNEQKEQDQGDRERLEQTNQQETKIQVYPPMESNESAMASSAQSSQQTQPHLLTHPQAMTSLSRCPMFPLPGSSFNVSGGISSNVNAPIDNKNSGSSNSNPTNHHNLESSSTHQVSVGNTTSSQTGCSSQTSGRSNNDSTLSSAIYNLPNTHNTSLPSWNDSMDIMYSPLFNIGGTNATVNTNHGGTSFNPFQCTPLNSAFGTSSQQNSMINHHYGMAINGFHPQVNAIVNPVLPLNNTIPAHSSGPARAGTTSPGTVKTSNAGKSMSGNTTLLPSSQQIKQQQAPPVGKNHQKPSKQKDKKATSERNEREQLRAKKITQLIHEIRSNMEAEGWKEEMKSKYETLSQCKAYMEHLKRIHKEKEINIEHTKKLIEEKALLEGRSDPESIHGSVTSSLTASSRRSTSPEENSSDKDSSSSCENYQQNRKKRKKISYAEGIKAPTSKGSNKKSRSLRDKRKEPSSSESSSEEDAGNEGPGGKNILFDKTSSSVSDMTDSNRSSMNGASVNKKKQGHIQPQVSSEIGAASTATSSISSTAAVVRGSSHKSPQSHRSNRSETKNAVVDGHGENQKKPYKKKRRSFDTNYKEVFLKSNIPQLIVTLSGRVVVWNDFFLLSTGLTKREAKSLSIFSIVDSSELTELYKFVAKALAHNKRSATSSAAGVDGPIVANAKSSDDESWQAITLKCIRFVSKSNKEEANHPHPLYITVTLLSDEDRDKRCFHCMITDCPGTKGAFGSVTPELLSLLFAQDGKGKAEKETS